MKRTMPVVLLVLFLTAVYGGDVIMTEIAPVGSMEFPHDWIEVQNITTGNITLNETYFLRLSSSSDTIPLLGSGESIVLAAADIAVIHFANGTTDAAIDENNPSYWDIYVGDAASLSASYQLIALFSDASTWEDAVFFMDSDNTYHNAAAESAVVSAGEWDTSTRPVYYSPGYGLQRITGTDHDNAYDWKNIAFADLNPGEENFQSYSEMPIELYQNYPNPFDKSKGAVTNIRFFLPAAAQVTLRIYTIAGDIIRTLALNEDMTAGFHEIQWLGDNDQGNVVQTGNFFIGLNAGGKKKVRKMTLLSD